MIALHGKASAPGLTMAAIWERRKLLLSLVAGAAALAGLLLLVIPPVYTGEALVAISVRTGQVFDHDQAVAVPPTLGQVQTEMEVLRSRGLAAQVVDQLSLTKDPDFNAALRPTPEILRAAGDWLSRTWAVIRLGLPGDHSGAPAPDERSRTVDAVMKGLLVSSDAESFAIHVKFRAKSPDKAALLANTFADRYVANQLKAKFDDVERAAGWVNKQVSTLQDEVNSATADAADFRERNHLAPMAADPGLMASQQLVALDTELGQASQSRADAEVKLHEAQSWLKNPADLPPVDLVAQSPFIQSLRSEEAVVLARLAEMEAHYRDNHPAVIGLKMQLAALRRNIAAEVQKVVGNLSAQLAEARSREAVLKQRMDGISAAANQQSRPLTEMAKRQREIDIKSGMLQTFMSRYNELTNRVDIEKADARVASRASPPTTPSHPKPLLFLGIAIVGSLGLGVALVSLLEHFRPGYVSSVQVRSELGLPTLGVVPQLPRLPGRVAPSDYMIEKPTSIYAEAIKAAQLAILDCRADGKGKRILVASSLPGEGKTAFAVSLARSMATSGYRVLLMDCDFRRPAVGRFFGVDDGELGLSDLLRQIAPVERVVRRDERTGLFYACAGTDCRDPQKLLDSTFAVSVLVGLMNKFDVTIIDSPPTMVASDAAVLARLTDLVLYVVAWDKTPRGAVQAGVDYLKSHGGQVAGVVLSKVDLGKGNGYGDYVNYAYRYGEYYAK